jgi:hypothetical protein
MEAESTFETSVFLNETTRLYNSEGCHIYSRCWENLKSELLFIIILVIPTTFYNIMSGFRFKYELIS